MTSGMRKRGSLLLAGGIVVLLAACSKDDSGGMIVPNGTVTVRGRVSSKVDETPVDGGVTMVLELRTGVTDTLLFGSLYTEPPPTQERLDLYRVIVEVQVGNWVRAVGKRVEGGIELQALTLVTR